MSEQDRNWWRSAVVYQVWPRSFSDSDGDGIGDINGITSRLDHLERLGVDVVWLSPIYRSPHRDFGYDISDYQALDPVFGTLDDFDRLVAALHDRGMKLVMDLVVNHTSDQHPWFVESRSSPANPKRDWYWWRPARSGFEPGEPGAEPTNWRGFFSQPTWTLDPTTGEYYLHLFAPEQPDLNWEHPEVRAAIYRMMRWWLDRGVDGFRMDVINLISKAPELADGPAIGVTMLGDGWDGYANGPRLHEYLQEMHREVFADRPGAWMTVGETPGVTVDLAREITDPDRRELDMVFQFEHMSVDRGADRFDVRPFDLRALKEVFGRWQSGLSEVGWNSLYWGNHDQPRAVSRFGDDERHWKESASMLAIVLHLQRGTPYVYQGEEIGMTNTRVRSLDDVQDVESLNYYAASVASGRSPDDVLAAIDLAGRDNARTPMQWDSTEGAGFTDGTAWMAVNSNHLWLNAANQYDDPTSVFKTYRAVIDLRHRCSTVVDGSFELLMPDHPHVYAYTRRLDDHELLVLGNFSASDQALPFDASWSQRPLVIGNYCDPPVSVVDDRVAPLRPWEARVYQRGVETVPRPVA
jgi:oligo-1,6-glucosidase